MISKQTKFLIRKKIAELNVKIMNQVKIRDFVVEKAKRETSMLNALKSDMQALKGDLQE